MQFRQERTVNVMRWMENMDTQINNNLKSE